MKKFFKYLFYIIIVSIFASVCRLLVLYLMTGELGQKPHIQTKQTLTYKDIDLGWAKTSLPFSLEENSQQAIKMKEAINNAFNAQIVNDIKLYQGTYNSKEFSLGIGRNVYIPSLSLTQNATENSFRDSITGCLEYAHGLGLCNFYTRHRTDGNRVWLGGLRYCRIGHVLNICRLTCFKVD